MPTPALPDSIATTVLKPMSANPASSVWVQLRTRLACDTRWPSLTRTSSVRRSASVGGFKNFCDGSDCPFGFDVISTFVMQPSYIRMAVRQGLQIYLTHLRKLNFVRK